VGKKLLNNVLDGVPEQELESKVLAVLNKVSNSGTRGRE